MPRTTRNPRAMRLPLEEFFKIPPVDVEDDRCVSSKGSPSCAAGPTGINVSDMYLERVSCLFSCSTLS